MRKILVLFLFTGIAYLFAQPINYHINLNEAADHVVQVNMEIPLNGRDQIMLALPAWAPGRYVIYNFSQNLFALKATDELNRPQKIEVIDKQTWQVECPDTKKVIISYRIFANTLDGTFSKIDSTGASLNGPGLFLYVLGRKNRPARLQIEAPADWKTVCPLPLEGSAYLARSYDQLIDSPIESGHLSVYKFKTLGALHQLVFHQPVNQALRAVFIEDLEKVIHQLAAVFGDRLPYRRYVFFFHLNPQLEHTDGMEHHNSCRVILRMDPNQITSDANTDADYDNLIWLSAHEYFHLWNVKRLRPSGLGPFDYTKEVYTPSLWFAEGATSYFAYLALVRGGIYTRQKFLSELSGRITRYEINPAKHMRSLEEVSRLTWLYKGNVPHYAETNVHQTTYSYYYKGLIVSFLLDLKLRQISKGQKSLDNLMALAWNHFAQSPAETYFLPGRGYTEPELEELAGQVAGQSVEDFFNQCLRSLDELPYGLLQKSRLQFTKSKNHRYELKDSSTNRRGAWPDKP